MGLLTFRDLGFLHGPHITWVVIGWEVQHTSAWTASCCLTHFCRRLWTTLQTGSSSSLGTHDLYNKKTRGDRSKPIPQERSAHPLLLVFTRVPFDPVMLWSRRMLWIPRDWGLCTAARFKATRCGWRCYFIKGLRWRCFHSQNHQMQMIVTRETLETEKNVNSIEHIEHAAYAALIQPQPMFRREVNLRSRPEEGKPSITPLGLAACCVQDEDSMDVAQTAPKFSRRTCCTCCTMAWYIYMSLIVVNCRWLSLCVIACCYLSPSCRCLFYSGVLLHVTDWSGCQMPGESLANQHQTVGIWGSCYRRIS